MVEKSAISLQWVSRCFVLAMVALVLASSPRANSGVNASVNQTMLAAEHNIDLLEFVTQSKLSPEERSLVAREVANGMSSAPQKVIERDGLIVTTLTNAARFPKDAPRLRELWRYDIAANVPHDNIQYELAEKYDATLVLDKTHQRIITEGTLKALRACTDWLAPNLHKPPPGAGLIASERSWLKSSYWHLPDDEQDAYGHVVRNCAHAPDFFNSVAATPRVQFFANNAKDVIDTGVEAKDAALIARIAYNILLHRAGGGAAMQGRVFDYMVQQSLLQQQLQRSVMRNPPLPPPN
jgi:hypothetical protein